MVFGGLPQGTTHPWRIDNGDLSVTEPKATLDASGCDGFCAFRSTTIMLLASLSTVYGRTAYIASVSAKFRNKTSRNQV